jgi:aminoethylphosphonate catabolism LysR family transcriptional regulator
MLYTILRAFHAVSENGSFSRAAEALQVSQPTISAQVRELEQRYSVTLFERRSRGVETTEIGLRLRAVTSRLFASESDAEELLTEAEGLSHGRLRIGADSPYLVVPLLGTFRRRHPGIQFSITFGNSEELLTSLMERRVDVAVLPEVEHDSRLHTVVVRRDRIVALVPVGHALARRRQLGLPELCEHSLILREIGSRTRSVFESAVKQAGLRLGATLEIGSREGVREAAAASLGIGIIAQSEVGADTRLRTVPIAGASLALTEYAASIAERRGVRVVRAFLELVAEQRVAPEQTRQR